MTSISMVPVKVHEANVRALGCCISRTFPTTLHHCHGGSMKDAQWHVGMGQKQNPFLQIPIAERYHTGAVGIDSGYGVLSWERDFGNQMDLLAWVNGQLPYDLWQQARLWEQANRANTVTSLSDSTTELPSTHRLSIDAGSN